MLVLACSTSFLTLQLMGKAGVWKPLLMRALLLTALGLGTALLRLRFEATVPGRAHAVHKVRDHDAESTSTKKAMVKTPYKKLSRPLSRPSNTYTIPF